MAQQPASSGTLGDPYGMVPPVRRRPARWTEESQPKIREETELESASKPAPETGENPETAAKSTSEEPAAALPPKLAPRKFETARADTATGVASFPKMPGVKAHPTPDLNRGWRSGDTGLGLPDPEPVHGRAVPQEETEAWENEQADRLRERVLRQLAAEEAGSSFRLPEPVMRFFRSACLLLGSLLGLVLVAQISDFYDTWRAMELPWRWIAGALFALLGGIIAGYTLRLFWFVGRLRGNRQVSVKALKALQERRELQTLAAERASGAVQQLRRYLTDFPAQKPGETTLPGVHASVEATLIHGRARLLERSRGNAPAQWIDEFARDFQKPIDQVAAKRVESYARRAGLASAASPNALLDQAIVLYTCTAMLGDLMKLYHLRPTFGQSAILLGQCIAQTYLAGMIGEAAEDGAESFSQALGDWLPATGGGLAKGVGAKTAEGGLNWFLVRRLGRAAIKILQPVRG